jgi:hypothetical protein
LVTLLDAIGSTYSNESVGLILDAGQWDEEAGEQAIDFETFFKVMEDYMTGSQAFVGGGRGDEHVISILYCPVRSVYFIL